MLVHQKTLDEGLERVRSSTRHCFACHHEPDSEAKLVALRDQVDRFRGAVRGLLSSPAALPSGSPKDDATRIGKKLTEMLNEMVALSANHLEQRTRESVTRINQANSVLFALVACGPVLLILMAIFFIHAVNRPLTVLTDATRRLKAGDMSVRVPDLKHEFHELGTGFNEMVGSLSQHVHEMQRAEQMAALGQLSAGIAHEIKNPLAAIKLTLQVLATELDLSDEDRKLFERMEEESRRIETLMKDLLSFARPKEPKLQSVDLNRLLEKAGVFGLQRVPGAGGKGAPIEIRKELAPDLPTIVGDVDQLIQVFMNVVLNGIEVMKEGGALTIQTSYGADEVRVDICDQGPGVPDELKEKIFEPFFTRKPKGTGLGLAVTRQIVEQHLGTIRVTDAQGGGACFRITLPAERKGA